MIILPLSRHSLSTTKFLEQISCSIYITKLEKNQRLEEKIKVTYLLEFNHGLRGFKRINTEEEEKELTDTVERAELIPFFFLCDLCPFAS